MIYEFSFLVYLIQATNSSHPFCLKLISFCKNAFDTFVFHIHHLK